jgi:hypothetical protein
MPLTPPSSPVRTRSGHYSPAPAEAAAERLLQYCHQWPHAELVYHASDMRLIVHSDASYLSEPNARSRVGGITYCGNNDDGTIVNGPIKCTSRILDCVVASAPEAEYGALYHNGREATEERLTLEDMGHPQQPTLIVCDNSCAVGLANNTVRQRRSKAMEMRFHWVRDRVRQGQFRVEWRVGRLNLADYFTKDYPVRHFIAMRKFFVDTPPRPPSATACSRRIDRKKLLDPDPRPCNSVHSQRRLTIHDLPDLKCPLHSTSTLGVPTVR